MARKQRIDSIEGQSRIVAKSARPIVAPAHVPLEDCDRPFWNSVIAEFARSEWSDHQLEIAAMLAKTMADLAREQDELRKEGSIAYSEKGTPVANPRKTLIQMHAGTILSFRRSLCLHARAQGDSDVVAKRRAAAKDIEQAADGEDDLIPRGPRLVK